VHICAVEFIGFHTLSTNNNKLDINVLGTPSFPLLGGGGGGGESGTYSKTPLTLAEITFSISEYASEYATQREQFQKKLSSFGQIQV
jgi:hypothetical protein